MIEYIPKIIDYPKVLDVTSAWGNNPTILRDIITRFNLKQDIALEIGVERGYSTTALANYFKRVIGVDTFDWEFKLDDNKRDVEAVRELLKDWANIELIKSRYEDFIINRNDRYDLIHIDVGYDTHCYETTYPAGAWAVRHSDCVLFHDTISFPEVSRACVELSEKYGFTFYNYMQDFGLNTAHCGLGILVKHDLPTHPNR